MIESLYSSQVFIVKSRSLIHVEFLVHQFLYSSVNLSKSLSFSILVVLDCSEDLSSPLVIKSPQLSLCFLIKVVNCLCFDRSVSPRQCEYTDWASSTFDLVIQSNRVVPSDISTFLSCSLTR